MVIEPLITSKVLKGQEFKFKFHRVEGVKVYANGDVVGRFHHCIRSTNIYLHSFDVSVEYQNMGVATEALKFLLRHLQPFKLDITLDVMHNNHAAIKVYERCGFIAVGPKEYCFTMIFQKSLCI